MTAPERFTGEETEPVDGSIQAFLRRLYWAVASSLPLRPPDTGRSNDGWRRSPTALARFSVFVLSLFAGASCARLRFKG